MYTSITGRHGTRGKRLQHFCAEGGDTLCGMRPGVGSGLTHDGAYGIPICPTCEAEMRRSVRPATQAEDWRRP